MSQQSARSRGLHPAWMLGLGTLLWLLEIAVIVWWHVGSEPEKVQHRWQTWVLLVAVHALTAVWLGVMWQRVLRWRRRSSLRIHPAVRAERERIAQDLHDGVGSHLVQALALLDSDPALSPALRNAIEHAMFSLRVEMEALDDVDVSLIERLASMRWRLQPLLTARGISMQWEMPLEEHDESPRAELGMQLALLAQEAMSNALQHSGCGVLRVCLRQQSGRAWVMEVADDGCGIAVLDSSLVCSKPQAARGWGLDGMRARAHRVGACFELDASPGQGTCVRVVLPAGPVF